jgi:hypothetical protein
MKKIFATLALVCPWILLGEMELTPDQINAIRSGEVVIGSKHVDGLPKGNVWAAVWIPGPVEPIWEVMLDCDRAPEFVPGLKSCEVISTGQNSDVRRHRVDPSFLLPEFEYEFRTEYVPLREIHFKRISGDLRDMEGIWILEADPEFEGIFVRYSVFLDPGFFVPNWMVRNMMKGNLSEVLESLREQVISLSANHDPDSGDNGT